MSQEVGIVTLKKNTTTYKCIIQVRYHPCHWPFFRFWVPETSLLTKDLSYFCQKVVVMLHYGWPSMAATIQPKSLDCIDGCQTRGECDDPCTVFFGSTVPLWCNRSWHMSQFFRVGIPDPKKFHVILMVTGWRFHFWVRGEPKFWIILPNVGQIMATHTTDFHQMVV